MDSLTFVGTATTLLRLGGFTVLTDPNFLHRGQRAYLGKGLWSRRLTDPAVTVGELPSLDAVVLSHLHGDHFGGIPFFVLDAQLVSGRTERLTIAGPPGTTERVREAMESMFPGSADAERRFPLEIQELELGRPNSVTGLTVTPYEVLHPSGAPATALRICTGDWVFAYSGDTEWTESLVDAARNADLLVAEAYFFDKRVPFHLDYATLRANHDRLDARRTVLTHLSADMLARRGEVEYEIATDGAIYEVERRGSAG
jgi:ribonuclease BN (tRNA processing enzyme)